MLTKNNILLITILFSINYALAQSSIELENEAKYWVWRDRLISDFVVPGTCTGCGIVIKWRGAPWPLDDGTYNNYYGHFDIGDEGFEMGLYMAVLATEWYIMLNSGMEQVVKVIIK